jgi:hypothetical protein
VIRQIFVPMSRDLRRYLKDYTSQPDQMTPATVGVEMLGEIFVPTQTALATKEILTLRPSFWGMSIDLKELWRRLTQWRKARGSQRG